MIRKVRLEDAAAIANIYKYYVENTAITFELVVPTCEEMESRIQKIVKKYPYLVYEFEGKVIGYAYAGLFKEREAYRFSTELSIYFDHELCGKGFGREITTALLAELASFDYSTVVVCITLPNERSQKLFESIGFEYAGVLKNVGYKFDKWLSIIYYTLPIKEYTRSSTSEKSKIY